ncbi:aldo/keto reductase [Dictyobacter kobayashii]|uniref:Oxidoreductase n=1 Tax=Dictyobacter kobayashii TaxID=2014872 RepID=A0A402AVB4_9CHLR|nr:aldo/keto reductase [Dictyobacter kobayashii]GCE23056.1 oxidoreductase [Dictyobacter kobayashii]
MTTTPTAATAGTVTIGNEYVVNRLGYGAMRLPGPGVWGEPAHPEEARAVLRCVVELGVNFLDTAVYYGPDVSNRLIAETLYPYPENLVIATKVGARRNADRSWTADMSPASLRNAIETNLRQLRLEQIHLVHCRYMPDADIPFADSVATLAEMQREGKIRHIGVSNVTLEQLKEAQAIIRVASVQNLYNLINREHEDLVDACTTQHIPFMPFFPLAIGQLGQAGSPLEAMAQRYQTGPAQIALAWLLARSPIMLPIPGTSSVQHAEENIAATAIQLSPEDFATLSNTK